MPHHDHVTTFELMQADALHLRIAVRKVGSPILGTTTTGLVVYHACATINRGNHKNQAPLCGEAGGVDASSFVAHPVVRPLTTNLF